MNLANYDLAETLFRDYVEKKIAKVRTGWNSAINALGYGKWIYPYGSYRDDDNTSGRRYILQQIHDHPKAEEITKALWDIWTGKVKLPSSKEIPIKTEWLDFHCWIGEKFIQWGLINTVGRDDLFNAKYDKVVLKIRDGEEILHQEEFFPRETNDYEKRTPLKVLGDEDDVRVEIRYSRHNAWGSGGKFFDWAKINGEWTALKFQGHAWDGEIDMGTQDVISSEEETLRDLIADVTDWANEIQNGFAHVRKWTKVLEFLNGNSRGMTPEQIIVQWERHNKNRRWTRVKGIMNYVTDKYS